jgi:hypothetical protein
VEPGSEQSTATYQKRKQRVRRWYEQREERLSSGVRREKRGSVVVSVRRKESHHMDEVRDFRR